MNIIQQQTIDFYNRTFIEREKYENFISKVRLKVSEYRKDNHKLEFIDYLMILLKQGYDKHLKRCDYPNDSSKCPINKTYENCLFFIQNERDELIENITVDVFSLQDRSEINVSLQKILEDLNKIYLGQEVTYNDLTTELNELKEFFYLNKKNWSHMLIGKLTEMVASGVISEAISKNIIDTVSKNYDGLIK